MGKHKYYLQFSSLVPEAHQIECFSVDTKLNYIERIAQY